MKPTHEVGISPPRAGERWILALALGLPTVATWVYFVVLSGSPAMGKIYALTKVIQFALPLLWIGLICRERIRLDLRSFRGTGLGVAFGVATAIAGWLLYTLVLKQSPAFGQMSERLHEKVTGMGAGSPIGFLLLGAFLSVIHSFLEEYYWRWFVFQRLRAHMPFVGAVALSSLGFMAHHVVVLGTYLGWEHWLEVGLLSLCVAAGGAFWAWLYARTGSLIGPWISHMLVDCVLMTIGYDQLWGIAR